MDALLFQKEARRLVVGHEYVEISSLERGARDRVLIRARRHANREFSISAIAKF
jgi:hypothetical protein